MTITVNCRTLSLSLNERGQAVSLKNREGGLELLGTKAPPVGLWELGLIRPRTFTDPLPPVNVPALPYEGHEWWANRLEYGADLTLDSNDASDPEVAREDESVVLTWKIDLDDGPLSIVIRIDATDPASQLRFGAEVTVPDAWAIKRVVFPRIRGFGNYGAAGEDALLYPECFGVRRRNPLADMTSFTGQYPSAAPCSQMLAWMHGGDGVYLGVQDPDTNHIGLDAQYVEGSEPAPLNTERWHVEKGAASWLQAPRIPLEERVTAERRPAIQLRCHHWPTMASSWTCPYPVVLEGFTGDWYGAAAIHRTFTSKQRWCRRGTLAERDGGCPTLAGLDLWFTRYGFHPGSLEPKPAWEFQDAMHRLVDFFGMPFGVHWYHWHEFSWHRQWPEFSPVVEGFQEVVDDLQARGVVIMPYIQGRLLYRDRADLDAERVHATVEANGQPYLEMYTSQDDWPLALCPNDAWSQTQWRRAAEMLWKKYGVEGAYYDQMTAMPPSLCYHAGHGHAPGGGTQYWEGYDRALADIAESGAGDPRRFISSELLADAFLDRVDLYLSIVPPLEDYVPLFPALYGDYTTLMGRNVPDAVYEDPQLFAICQGEQLLFGGQLGWMDERILDHTELAVYLRDLARLRARLRDFLHLGTLEAPLEMEQTARISLELAPAVCAKPAPVRIDRDAVRHTVWRAPDGRRLVLLLNESNQEAGASWAEPSPGNRRLWELGCTEPTPLDGGRQMNVTIPPLGVVGVESTGTP